MLKNNHVNPDGCKFQEYNSKSYKNISPSIFIKSLFLKAFTYLEILIGIAIISSILFGMSGVFGIGIRSNRKADNIIIALGIGQELIEQTMARDFGDIVSIEPEDVNGFTRRLDVTHPYMDNEDRKLVKVTVSGTDITDIELNCIIVDPTL